LVISNHESFRVLFDKIASVFYLKKKSVNILASEMASPKNRHCANCIGTLSFPILSLLRGRPKYKRSLMLALDVAARPEVIDQRIVHIEPLAR